MKRRIMAGTFALSREYYDANYRIAQKVGALMTNDMTNAFLKGVDVLVGPVSATPAFKFVKRLDNHIWDVFS